MSQRWALVGLKDGTQVMARWDGEVWGEFTPSEVVELLNEWESEGTLQPRDPLVSILYGQETALQGAE